MMEERGGAWRRGARMAEEEAEGEGDVEDRELETSHRSKGYADSTGRSLLDSHVRLIAIRAFP
jgi:hypothetical protein